MVRFIQKKLATGFPVDQPLDPEQTKHMSRYLSQLERRDLPASLIRTTGIHKTIKCITMIAKIPKENDLHLKSRTAVLLKKWSEILGPEVEDLGTSTRGAESNMAPSQNETQRSNISTNANGSLRDRHESPVSISHQPKEGAKLLTMDLTDERGCESGTSTSVCHFLI